jgi:hypothetical protein
VLLAVGLNLTGCSGARDVASVAAVPRQAEFAPVFCLKQHAGRVGAEVPAGFAAKELQAAM